MQKKSASVLECISLLKETYTHAKETYTHAKETHTHAKETYTHAKETYRHTCADVLRDAHRLYPSRRSGR